MATLIIDKKNQFHAIMYGPDPSPWDADGSTLVGIFYENFDERPDVMSDFFFPNGKQSLVKKALSELSDEATECLDWVRKTKLVGSCTLSWFGLHTTHNTYEVSFHLTFENKADFEKFSKRFTVVQNTYETAYMLDGVEICVTNYC
jgi:hypothetical protein